MASMLLSRGAVSARQAAASTRSRQRSKPCAPSACDRVRAGGQVGRRKLLTLMAAAGSSSTEKADAAANETGAAGAVGTVGTNVYSYSRPKDLETVKAGPTTLPVIILPGFGVLPSKPSHPSGAAPFPCDAHRLLQHPVAAPG